MTDPQRPLTTIKNDPRAYARRAVEVPISPPPSPSSDSRFLTAPMNDAWYLDLREPPHAG